MAPSTPNNEAMKGREANTHFSPYITGLVTLKINPDRLAQLNLNNTNPGTPTAATTMVGRSFVPDAATAGNSRAASADRTGDRVAMPTMAATHGAPTRQYLNSKVTAHVVEAMKIVAKEQYVSYIFTRDDTSRHVGWTFRNTDNVWFRSWNNRPADPLRVLGEFLLQRSKEFEGTTDGTDGEAAGDEANEADINGDEQ